MHVVGTLSAAAVIDNCLIETGWDTNPTCSLGNWDKMIISSCSVLPPGTVEPHRSMTWRRQIVNSVGPLLASLIFAMAYADRKAMVIAPPFLKMND